MGVILKFYANCWICMCVGLWAYYHIHTCAHIHAHMHMHTQPGRNLYTPTLWTSDWQEAGFSKGDGWKYLHKEDLQSHLALVSGCTLFDKWKRWEKSVIKLFQIPSGVFNIRFTISNTLPSQVLEVTFSFLPQSKSSEIVTFFGIRHHCCSSTHRVSESMMTSQQKREISALSRGGSWHISVVP